MLFLTEHDDLEYFTCVSTSFCDCPSSYQLCKHLHFLRTIHGEPHPDEDSSSPPVSPGRPPSPPQPLSQPKLVDHWEALQTAIQKLAALRQEDITAEQTRLLAIGAQNLVQLAETGERQPELYELRRGKLRSVGSSDRKRVCRERTRAPMRKQHHKRAKQHKRQHKQTRLTKDSGLSSVLVRFYEKLFFFFSMDFYATEAVLTNGRSSRLCPLHTQGHRIWFGCPGVTAATELLNIRSR